MLKGKCRLLDSIIWLYNKSVEIEKPFDVCDEVFEYDDSVALFFLKKGFLRVGMTELTRFTLRGNI